MALSFRFEVTLLVVIAWGICLIDYTINYEIWYLMLLFFLSF